MERSLFQCVYNKTQETKVSSSLTPPAGHSVKKNKKNVEKNKWQQFKSAPWRDEEKQSTAWKSKSQIHTRLFKNLRHDQVSRMQIPLSCNLKDG